MINHPVIIFPFVLIAFFELFSLEIIYFIPRWPLSIIFAPVIRAIWSEQALHYPFNFPVIYNIFYAAQIIIYVFLGGYLTAVSSATIYHINENKPTGLRIMLKKAGRQYINIFCVALLLIVIYFLIREGYGLFIKKFALGKIGSSIRIIRGIKKVLVLTNQYAVFLFTVIAETMLAYCIPILIVENKKLFAAIKENFIFLKKTFFATFIFVLAPSLLLLPLIYANGKALILMDKVFPEVIIMLIAGGIIFSLFINAFIITVLTSFYLLKRKT
ncbi:MAG: hypothetical protein COV72_02800 [Candidatus Omnitrophica bacterium CG11_big_fil_rev_8_21_14_0_20_42_13]|uniref:Glycerophosphoryl diester phosphodiesterase membrane domain-containing protein n=1 Tax=Candidatus Ghiorseimicrobium undicola TaxID=1974746 RepID=A0A2H0LYJ0_9BACT|nr:MAG: hypothetical protein COV72_02800 [Candidatus Omnitrophica bacterium CG11_big_fil_rev_8_21_14_0_20_42_13]